LGLAALQQARSPQENFSRCHGRLITVRNKKTDAWEKEVLSARVQAGRKALRIRNTNVMKVRKKRPRGFK
jgi:hypothetical protein